LRPGPQCHGQEEPRRVFTGGRAGPPPAGWGQGVVTRLTKRLIPSLPVLVPLFRGRADAALLGKAGCRHRQQGSALLSEAPCREVRVVVLDLLLTAAIASVVTTLVVVMPRLVRMPLVPSLLLSCLALAASGLLADIVTRAAAASVGMCVALVAMTLISRRWLSGWTWMATQLSCSALVSFLLYVAYSLGVTLYQAVTPHLLLALLVGSLLIIVGELLAMGLALSYLFEILDVLGRRFGYLSPPPPVPSRLPRVAIQVPMYNEPVELVRETLQALSRLDYPDFLVQAVDNNTKDVRVWEPIQELCAQLGPRFQFLHLEPWPGFKAGALNEATRRLPADVEVIAIVDADYLVRPGFLRAAAPYFSDPQVGFVQTPQHYRDWADEGYLRGLFHSYRYFFDVTMPARAHRDAIIFCGTMGLIRRSVLERIGGWNEDCITEDAEASLRILGLG